MYRWPYHPVRMDLQTYWDRIEKAQTDDELADVVVDMLRAGVSLSALPALLPLLSLH